MKHLIQPNLPEDLQTKSWELVTDYDIWEDCAFEQQTITGSYHDIEFRHCHFTNCDFSQATIYGMNCVHVIFDHCDLSNLDFSNVTMQKVIFQDCKLVGTNFATASLKHVQFLSCLGRFINFSFATIDYLLVKDSDFTESVWNEVKWKHREVWNSNLTQAEFFHTSLQDLDVTNSWITGIHITPDSLVGIQVNQLQAISLIQVFGVVVKE